MSPEEDTSPVLDPGGIKRIQAIIGALLYYARAVDNKLLVALSTLGTQANKLKLLLPRRQTVTGSLTTALPILMMALFIVPVIWS